MLTELQPAFCNSFGTVSLPFDTQTPPLQAGAKHLELVRRWEVSVLLSAALVTVVVAPACLRPAQVVTEGVAQTEMCVQRPLHWHPPCLPPPSFSLSVVH